MIIEDLIDKMKKVQSSLLEFLENETNEEENYENFINLISNQKINEDKHELRLFLRLINEVSNNHQRVSNLINKIEKILDHLQKDIKKYFTNSQIFELFKENLRILLFLFQEKIIAIDESIVSEIIYREYFAPEIKPFLTEKFICQFVNKRPYLVDDESPIKKMMKEIPSEFYEKRKEGENDNYLCELMRKDDVKEFGAYTNRQNTSLNDNIERSIYETNHFFLFQNGLSFSSMPKFKFELVEYAAFFGSICIIKYMHLYGNIELTPFTWLSTVHSQNAELIKYLEDNQVPFPDNKYDEVLYESIKCHHNDVSNYIINHLIDEKDLKNDIENDFDRNLYAYAVRSYNFCFFPKDMKYKNMFFYLCEYDYYTLVKLYLENYNIDINATAIRI